MPLTESQTRYVNFYTDFAFKSEEELAKYTPQERQDYEESLKTFRDWYSVIKTAEMKGHDKGRIDERIENIRRMRSKGLDDEAIADLLGLDIDFVKQTK